MALNLNQAKNQALAKQLLSSIPLTEQQMRLLALLNDFAIHQAEYDPEVRQFPAKMMYKVNDELKMALVAFFTTCALLDPKRHRNETQEFFDNQIKIIQDQDNQKVIDFGCIRPELVQKSIFPEIVDDWILYRDINGDGIHALMDRKTHLQGLSNYTPGTHPVYEFARFYRTYMEKEIAKRMARQEEINKMAAQALVDQTIHNQLATGKSAKQLLNHILSNDTEALFDDPNNINIPKLPKK